MTTNLHATRPPHTRFLRCEHRYHEFVMRTGNQGAASSVYRRNAFTRDRHATALLLSRLVKAPELQHRPSCRLLFNPST